MDASRRHFLQGNVRSQNSESRPPVRLPWVISDAVFLDGCSRCGDCINACPQSIVVKGDGGFPTLDFSQRECTFCSECVQACHQPLFNTGGVPWQQVATISQTCLTFDGIVCQNCKDACEPQAIRFQFGTGGLSRPEINSEACTGCGACVAPCPNDSISMHTNEMSI